MASKLDTQTRLERVGATGHPGRQDARALSNAQLGARTRLSLIRLAVVLCLLLPGGESLADGRLEPDPVFGGQVYVQEFGDPANESLVLVHGLGDGATEDWLPLIERLQARYHILTLDLPGFGGSDAGDGDYSPTRYAQLLRLLAKRHIGRPFHLAGHSMGAAIALRYAANYPQDIKTLTLVDAAGILHRLAYTKYLAPLGLEQLAGRELPARNLFSQLAGELLDRAQQRLPVDPELLLDIPPLRRKMLGDKPGALAAYALVKEDFSRVPQRIEAPTLILWGEHDRIAPVRTGQVLDALIPRSELHIIAGAGHAPISQRPDQVLALMQPLLDGQLIPATDPQKPEIAQTQQGRLACDGRYGQTYKGHIEHLVLNRCTDVTIRDARISGLEIVDSTVQIENSIILGEDIGIQAQGSTVQITAGKVAGRVAIRTDGSRFDIAGTDLSGTEAAIEAVSDSSFIFSVVLMDSPYSADDVIHGAQQLDAGQRL